MDFDRGVTKYDIMPIPPVRANCERFEAGPISIWVEYRLLDDAITAAHTANEGYDGPKIEVPVEDRGVSLHVFGPPVASDQGAEGGHSDQAEIEYLRFDCFDEDPHYHYVSYARTTNEMVHMDPVVAGDSLEWALGRIKTRLPHMLARAGAAALAEQVDRAALESVLPKVAEAAYRARFRHEESEIHAAALAPAGARSEAPSSSGSRS